MKRVKIINRNNNNELIVSMKKFKIIQYLLSENSTYEVLKK